MVLATKGENLCICTVYYAVDNQFNLYFLSEPKSEHCQNISRDNTVACAIADSTQKVTDKKVGVQIKGEVTEVRSLEKTKRVLALWNMANPGFESVINLKNMQKKIIQSKVYKVTPHEIKFLNEVLYGPEGTKLFKM